jgi:hypothetical protein
MRAAGHAMIPPLNNLPAHGRRALREFSSGHSVPSMIYQAYRTQAAYLDLVRPLAAAAGTALRLPWPRLGQDWPLHTLAGVLETFANLTVSHARLPFGIDSVQAGTQRPSPRCFASRRQPERASLGFSWSLPCRVISRHCCARRSKQC